MKLQNCIIRNVVNIPGKGVNFRKILVIESDDWGSIRTRSKKDIEELKKIGFKYSGYPYYEFNLYDSLESNDDLEGLFEVLSRHKDKNGKNAIFTLASNPANPNFEKIMDNGYKEYIWEPFTETLNKYGISHDRVYELHKEGISNNLIYPVFHGREHLNVQRWMRYLQKRNKSVQAMFEHGICNYYMGIDNIPLGELPAAFDLEFDTDLEYQYGTISTGLKLFEKLWGFRCRYFVPPNGPYNQILNSTIAEHGVEYLLGERLQKEPIGNGKYVRKFNWIGSKNSAGLVYLNRSGFFEPTYLKDTTKNALLAIERAFRWGKPAIISSHRVNYCGYIFPENRNRSLKMLDEFLTSAQKKWPDIEFMTSVEVGDLLKNKK